jgi:hypothetical protein
MPKRPGPREHVCPIFVQTSAGFSLALRVHPVSASSVSAAAKREGARTLIPTCKAQRVHAHSEEAWGLCIDSKPSAEAAEAGKQAAFTWSPSRIPH